MSYSIYISDKQFKQEFNVKIKEVAISNNQTIEVKSLTFDMCKKVNWSQEIFCLLSNFRLESDSICYFHFIDNTGCFREMSSMFNNLNNFLEVILLCSSQLLWVCHLINMSEDAIKFYMFHKKHSSEEWRLKATIP